MSEAALLVALPQSPEVRRPDLFPNNASEFVNTIHDSNISPYSPYILISKEPIRNT